MPATRGANSRMGIDFTMIYRALPVVIVVVSLLTGTSTVAGDDPASTSASGGTPSQKLAGLKQRYRRSQQVQYPAWNRHTPAREELGRRLFFDTRLSNSGTFSCGTCHKPELAWSDGFPKAVGPDNKVRARRTPTIVDAAFAERLQWDGRARILEDQVLLNTPAQEIVRNVNTVLGYKELFQQAYPGEPMNDRTVAKAIATFERGIVSTKAPFDRWVEGDENAVSPAAKRGFLVFDDKGNCSTCHATWRFTNDSFHDTGLPSTDIGRGKYQANIRLMQFAFKTPTLRDVAKRDFFMHDGSLKSLRDVIDHYDRGGVMKRESLSSGVYPLRLTEREKRDLISFLETLTSEEPVVVSSAIPK